MVQKQDIVRILCVFSRLDRGGAETMCMELYRHMDRSRVQFDFIKHTPDKCAFEDEIISLGGKIYEAPSYKAYNHLAYCRWWKRFLSAHPEYRIIHGHFFTVAAVFFKVCRRMGRITIAHSHSTSRISSGSLRIRLKWLIQASIMKKLEDRSDFCFACSEAAGKWLFPHKQFTVLNNAIDSVKFVYSPEVRHEVRRELGLADETFVVGVVGSIYAPKNPLGVADIFKAVHDREPGARLLWVGDGEMRGQAAARLAEHGLEGCAMLTGVRSDVPRLMQAMDVFMLPSLYEGLGIVAVEAQAAGLPTFCSDVIPHEAAVTDLCTFLPLTDYGAWAEALLSASAERRDMSAEIRAAGYDIQTTSAWLQNFYLRCAGAGGTE